MHKVHALLDHPAEAIALRDASGHMTYGALREAVDALADRLAAVYAQSGGAFAIDMPDSAAWVVADLACLMIGIPAVPLPPFFTDAQRQHALKTAGVTWCIDSAEFHLRPTGIAPVTLPARTAKITFTSGTTGDPKGVCLSREHMLAKAHQLRKVLGADMISHHRSLLPLAVLLENIAGVYVALGAGAQVTLGVPEYTPQALVAALEESQATSCILVPELLRALVASGQALPKIRYAAVGGAHVPAVLIARARAQGIAVYEGYGLSEACSVVALNTPRHDCLGSCGRVLEQGTVQVADDGEILLSEPQFLGYVGMKAPPRPFPTGDLGHVDADGCVHLIGRKKHLIITSYGRNVSPEWVENALVAQPGIVQAMVVGDGKPFNCAIIVARADAAVAHAVQEANSELPDYASVGAYFIADAPFSVENAMMTPTGKLNRSAIAAHYAAKIAAIYEEIMA